MLCSDIKISADCKRNKTTGAVAIDWIRPEISLVTSVNVEDNKYLIKNGEPFVTPQNTLV